MLKRKKIFIVLAILALTGGIYGYLEFTRKTEDLAHVRADYMIGVKDLVTAFESDEISANEKFLDKIIAVKGVIKDIIKDDHGYYTVMMGEENTMSSVRCSIDPSHATDVEILQAGNVMAIKGACTGFNADELLGSDVILNRCVIEKK